MTFQLRSHLILIQKISVANKGLRWLSHGHVDRDFFWARTTKKVLDVISFSHTYLYGVYTLRTASSKRHMAPLWLVSGVQTLAQALTCQRQDQEMCHCANAAALLPFLWYLSPAFAKLEKVQGLNNANPVDSTDLLILSNSLINGIWSTYDRRSTTTCLRSVGPFLERTVTR